MGMNIRNRITSTSTELINIEGIGFIFEVNESLEHNLICPEILALFDEIQESEEVTINCAFPPIKPNTNLRYSIFKNMGYDWVVCSDGVFRKCQIIKCKIQYNNSYFETPFYIDKEIKNNSTCGIIASMRL